MSILTRSAPANGDASAGSTSYAPGSFFDVPGVGGGTQWTEQYETTIGLASAFSLGAQQPVNGIIPFKQTDVVVDWIMEVALSTTYTAGTSTLTTSVYAPYNLIGPVKLPIQNQYNSVDLENGIDLAILNLIRPYRETANALNNYANVDGQGASTATGVYGYITAAGQQANAFLTSGTATGQWVPAGTNALTLYMRIPASITFDIYYDLAITGEPVGTVPHAAIVSPAYMAGSTRVITPNVVQNQLSGPQLDVAAVNIGTGTGTASGTATFSFRRKAIYAADPLLLPPVYAWQYRWRTTRFQLNGVSTRQLQVPLDTGQLLCVYVRLFDPSANGALGAPVAVNNATVSRIQLQYGSGLFAFDGTPTELQADFLDKHRTLPPPGVAVFDLMLDERGNRTNRRALNTLTTSGILVSMNFASATSATAYAVMGTESLVYVA